MKSIFKLLVLCILLLTVGSCKNEKEEKQEATEVIETKAEVENITVETKISKVLNANLATEADLTALGLSAEIVAQILSKRPFLSMNDLDALLTDTNKEELYKTLFVPFNLNTTAEADFKMIPGVGDKMAHEFEEYRPYVSVKQFKREIGKYVDEDEVERYLNYVFVPVELNTASEEDIKSLPGVGKKMTHEFEEYRPYKSMEQFRKEIGKYVDDKELKRLERLVYLKK
ncbi:helix-hairpin-helix domain-containing protein [Winogradskyella flava]|uniref:Helix-hairpin-helix domain-containing protein n=1 Tax=Winogradskyella flava TaxID=1884876 RepID=A0A842ISY8_9FLAO|nr:helix-hairpin-helix domain-containing protein [Winogradskyella flava]MBC2845895.1 helix-hairpin-helix domain-containing protein [Winogradskyella flava]